MKYKKYPLEPIALVGSSCRFAGGVTSPSDLWELLSKPTDLSQPVPSNRFSIDGFFHRDPEHHGTTDAPRAYWLDQDHRAFDASFFNITPKEAEAMDPQQRLLLEVVYEALESAGYTLQHCAGQNVAVYAGVMTRDYDTLSSRDDLNVSQYAATGNARSIISNRISYFFDFRGPSMTIDTACSASLVALHQAVQSLRSGESPMACVAGVNLMLTPEQFIAESNLHMLSPSGHCQMWDAKADGYARGEGVAALFIKPLSRALKDGDQIQAIIRETGVNSDGRTKGITMPSSEAQSALIRQTYQKSGLDPLNVDHRPQFFEAHGTGTPVGDPIEARAISETFFPSDNAENSTFFHDDQQNRLLVGSVKTVIGHTEGAAGLAGILKVIQAMEHGCILPNLHYSDLNQTVAPFYQNLQVPVQSVTWPTPSPGQPRRASVNSFGFGGTNAHAIIEKYEPEIHNYVVTSDSITLPVNMKFLLPKDSDILSTSPKPRIVLPLIFSAMSKQSLAYTLQQHRNYIIDNSAITLETLGWHLYRYRTSHPFRTSIVVDSISSAVEALDIFITASSSNFNKGTKVGHRSKPYSTTPKVLGIFTGQGAQYVSMSKELFQINFVYRETIRELDDILRSCPDTPAEMSLEQQLHADQESSRVNTAQVSQVLCTALQIALVDLLKSLGVTFHSVVGHSSGEIAAAYAAKRLTRRDAILISYYRGRYTPLASSSAGGRGGMLACSLSRASAEELCSRPEYCNKLWFAASNSPTLVTLSGDLEAVQNVVSELKSQDVFVRQLIVDVAYHSPHMHQPVVAYSKALVECGIQPLPQDKGIRWISSVYGEDREVGSEDLANSYWCDNMTSPVNFREALETVLKYYGPFDCAIEVGPHPALKAPARETVKMATSMDIPYMSLLDRTKNDRLTMAAFLGDMWTNFGPTSVNIESYVDNSSQPEIRDSRLTNPPSYAWDHSQIYWRESRLSEQFHFRKCPPHELLGVRTSDDNHFQLRWRNILKLDKLPWVEGHKFQGQALLPASAYCIMALDAAKVLLNNREASVIELQDLEFLSGIPLDADSMGVETLFTLFFRPPAGPASDNSDFIEANFDLTSVPISSFGFEPMKQNFRGRVRITLDTSAKGRMPLRQSHARAETLPVSVDAFYSMMKDVGLDYTGPFKALKSLNRRLDYAVGTLDKRHALETADLSFSPAMLDSCFHTSFATFSSPGDKSLWTTFLPTKMARLCFNVAPSGSLKDHDELLIETYLTSVIPHSAESPAIITSDLEVYSQSGQMEIQLEGLKVSSFASARPDKDYELYLHTIYELDPEDEIVTAISAQSGDLDNFSIKDSKCQPEAQLLPKRSQFPMAPTTPPESPEESDTEMPELLELTTELTLPAEEVIHMESKSHIFPLVGKQTQHLLGFQKHLARVVKQISHKYPRMRILDLSEPDSGFTQHILEQLDGAFLSYNIGHGSDHVLSDRFCTIKGNEKVKNEVLDLSFSDTEDDRQDLNDLVILSASVLQHTADQLHMLKGICKITRHGGFLIFIDMCFTSMEDPSGNLKTLETDLTFPDALPDWPRWLEDECDFAPLARNHNQYYPSVASVYIQQAGGRALAHMLTPQPNLPVMRHLLMIGGQSQEVATLSEDLESTLQPYCELLTTANSLDNVLAETAERCTAVILLSDLEEPVCTSMTLTRLESLKSLMRPGVVVLWVTLHARHDPDRASSLGLTRSLKAETPNLTLQVLDLDRRSGVTSIVSESFLRLCSEHELSQRDKLQNLGRHIEPEIHVGNGKILIPRVVPYRPAIDRLNAYRRIVTTNFNSQEVPVHIEPFVDSKGITRYTAGVLEDTQVGNRAIEGSVTVRVEYSSLCSISIRGGGAFYVFAGRRVDSKRLVVGLSKISASVVHVQPGMLQDVEAFTTVETLLMVTTLWQMMFAINMATRTGKKDIVLMEPDRSLLHCVRYLLSAPTSAALTQTITSRRLHVLSCDQRLIRNDADIFYLQPWSTAREIRCTLPLEDCTVINLLDREDQLSKTLTNMRGAFKYHYADEFLSEDTFPLENADMGVATSEIWAAACGKALDLLCLQDHRMFSLHSATPSQILEISPSSSHPTGTIIDWQSDPSVSITVKPLANPRCLRKDRTYVLVGLTRDLGQSICRLFLQQGARHIVVASRNPDLSPAWVAELNSQQGADIRVERLDVTNLADTHAFKARLVAAKMPTFGGVVNAAMVLDDRVFSQMDMDTWTRVMRPKTVGSKNLDIVFDDASPDVDLDFFLMTSSFAAIGGHAGQSNYAAANMYMNGLAAQRRRRGLAASALNIGVIYGLGLLAREDRQSTYSGLERDGYPPISERDLHHMFMEAIEAGRRHRPDAFVPVPVTDGQQEQGPGELTTGLGRYRVDDPRPMHWHLDRRFCHFTVDDKAAEEKSNDGREGGTGGLKHTLKDLIKSADSAEEVADVLLAAFLRRVEAILQHPAGSVGNGEVSFVDLGVDSLAAVEIRNWVYKAVGQDVPVMKILGSSSIQKLCIDVAEKIIEGKTQSSQVEE